MEVNHAAGIVGHVWQRSSTDDEMGGGLARFTVFLEEVGLSMENDME